VRKRRNGRGSYISIRQLHGNGDDGIIYRGNRGSIAVIGPVRLYDGHRGIIAGMGTAFTVAPR